MNSVTLSSVMCYINTHTSNFMKFIICIFPKQQLKIQTGRLSGRPSIEIQMFKESLVT